MSRQTGIIAAKSLEPLPEMQGFKELVEPEGVDLGSRELVIEHVSTAAVALVVSLLVSRSLSTAFQQQSEEKDFAVFAKRSTKAKLTAIPSILSVFQ